MKMTEIRKIAKEKGLKADIRMKKVELVRAIQKHEGNPQCYMTGQASRCAEANRCCWADDCR